MSNEILSVDGEEWLPCIGFENYMISNKGRIKTTGRMVIYSNGRNRIIKSKLINTYISHNNFYVCIFKNKKRYTECLETLINKTFNIKPSDLKGEVWKTVEEHPLYQVSNKGRFKTFHNKVERILKTYLSKAGYEIVRFIINGKSKGFIAHRIVAKHHLLNPDNLPVVHHINNIKNDNRVENLMWVTEQRNRDFAWRDKRFDRSYAKSGCVADLKDNRPVPLYYTDKNFNPSDEIWINVKNFENKYKVSNYGRLIRINKCGEKFIKPKICLLHCNKRPLMFSLSKNGEKEKAYTIHKLVALHFMENLNNLPEINHKSGDKYNNHVSNLEWITHKGNMQHAYDNKLYTTIGERNPFSKLTEKQVLEIRKLYEIDKISKTKLGKIYGVGTSNITNIINKIIWKHI